MTEHETIGLRKDGSRFPFYVAIDQVVLPDGPAIMGLFTDITERKRTEQALRESEKRFRTLSDATFEGILVHADGHVLEVNQAIIEQSGYSREELIGRSISDFFIPEFQEMVGKLIQRQVVEAYEAQLRRKDGERRTYQIQGRSIEYKGRSARVATLMDITERKRAEEEIKRSNSELQQFAFIASHDLREPLRMVSSYLDLLEKKYKGKVLDGTAEEYIDFAVDGAGRMRGMIDDLLLYSRIETRAKPFAIIDMNDVVSTALMDLRERVKESGAAVSFDGLPKILADETQMFQLMENLINDAIKFHADEPPMVEITAQSKGDDWVFSVEDNGIGIPKDQQGSLFQMFQRLHGRDEYEGTGIGLAIAKKIVEHHGGRIWVESEVGKGTTFFFTIPKVRY